MKVSGVWFQVSGDRGQRNEGRGHGAMSRVPSVSDRIPDPVKRICDTDIVTGYQDRLNEAISINSCYSIVIRHFKNQ